MQVRREIRRRTGREERGPAPVGPYQAESKVAKVVVHVTFESIDDARIGQVRCSNDDGAG